MPKLSCVGIIPARYDSKRLPGKPLKLIGERTLLEHVWRQASKARLLEKVIIATDDERIYKAAQSFGAEVMMTSTTHQSGSDRIAEVAEKLACDNSPFPLIANIQGDMPFINPAVIDSAVEILFQAPEDVGVSTVAVPIISEGDFLQPSMVKVVFDENFDALYFSRAPIPYWRERDVTEITEETPFGFKHLGLYVYHRETLRRITSLPQSEPELRERLEQLRALSNGIKIRVSVVSRAALEPSIEVDTPADLERACRALAANN